METIKALAVVIILIEMGKAITRSSIIIINIIKVAANRGIKIMLLIH